ncbi:MAG: hypothetical protein V4438_02020 [Patescibacteria group bacterium]
MNIINRILCLLLLVVLLYRVYQTLLPESAPLAAAPVTKVIGSDLKIAETRIFYDPDRAGYTATWVGMGVVVSTPKGRCVVAAKELFRESGVYSAVCPTIEERWYITRVTYDEASGLVFGYFGNLKVLEPLK